MILRSLGYRTDLIFPAFDGEILDRGEFLVIRTPANPTFYWGNFLLFPRPPRDGDASRWRELFRQEIGREPHTSHQTFGWDSPEGETGVVEPFLEAGFRLLRGSVMACDAPRRPPRTRPAVTIRPLATDAEWQEAIEVQVLCNTEFDTGGYRAFRELQMDRYRKMATASLGAWYGAFLDERLVADLGLFTGGGMGRYQNVETHPEFRGRGIAGTLVVEAAQQAMLKHRLDRLVIVADEESVPKALYESLGFREVEKQVGLERFA
jgi:ribosomal protein S18 acetylase RimI-like enzyme